MAVIDAVVMDTAKTIWPKMIGGSHLKSLETISYFRVGEGGWQTNPSTLLREPRDPAAHVAELDLDIIVDASRTPVGTKRYNVGENLGWFQKALLPSDITFEAPNILKVTCVLLATEYNTKWPDGTLVYNVGGPYGNPEIWEIGVYDTDDNLVAYGTFDKQIKTATAGKTNIVKIVFG